MKIRTGDISFVIDYILGETKKHNADKVYKLVDTTRIGVMGHSLGGSAVLGIGRMRKDVGHLTLTDLALTSPFLTRILNGHKSTTSAEYCVKVINKISLNFFDCYLKGEGQFKPSDTY